MSAPASPRPTAMRSLVRAFGRQRVLVVGDVMVDRYYEGSVRRISPEAPVPVVEVTGETQRFGGAANVAHNIRRLGAAVDLCAVVGDDPEGRWLAAELAAAGIGVAGLVVDPARPTSLKCRVVAHHQHVVRFDREQPGPHAPEVRGRLERQVARAFDAAGAAVVSDYGKGVVHPSLMARLRALRRSRRLPVAVDPKSPHFELYRGASVVTPNLGEALAAARVRGTGEALVERAGAVLQRRAGGAAILVTRGDAGMSLFEPGRPPVHIPTVAREVYDVTGAGDTVVAVVTLALAAGAPLPDAARLANVAAGIVVGEFGTVPVTRELLLDALGGGGAGR